MKNLTISEMKETVNYGCYPKMAEEETVAVRGHLEKLTCLNTCYRDTNGQVYVENGFKAIERLIKRLNRDTRIEDTLSWTPTLHEDLEYCLCCADWDFKGAKDIYYSHYY